MAGRGKARYGVRLLRYLAVAGHAQIIGAVGKERHFVRGVGHVAGKAHPSGNRGVHCFFVEERFVMAGKAQFRRFRQQQLRYIRRVGVVAGGAAHAESGMNALFFKSLFGMTAIAKVRLFGGKVILTLEGAGDEIVSPVLPTVREVEKIGVRG